jgi:adenine C2-methylase RlmN of 23S rRNA A2503 and tRNA A37
MITLEDIVNLPSGRIFICKTQDPSGKPYIIESTEMQDVLGKENPEVLTTDNIELIKKNLVPYEVKWLMTVSTQLGCGYACKFCDVPLIPFRGNLSMDLIMSQIRLIFEQSPNVKRSDKVKIGFARMGEPALNWINVLGAIKQLKGHDFGDFRFLPCYNSIVPDRLIHDASPFDILSEVLKIKEVVFEGFLHIQLSVNSTDEDQRTWLFGGAKVIPLRQLIDFFDSKKITDRTITLNFICGDGWQLDIDKLKGLDPLKFAIKLIPLNETTRGNKYELKPYANYRNFDLLKKRGDEIRNIGLNVVADTIAKCEEAGLCCGQLAHIYMKKYRGGYNEAEKKWA